MDERRAKPVRMTWRCPMCGEGGTFTTVAHPSIGEYMAQFTSIEHVHKDQSPTCVINERTGGYVRLLVFPTPEELKEKKE